MTDSSSTSVQHMTDSSSSSVQHMTDSSSSGVQHMTVSSSHNTVVCIGTLARDIMCARTFSTKYTSLQSVVTVLLVVMAQKF